MDSILQFCVNKRFGRLAASALILLCAGVAYAGETPTSLSAATVVDAFKVKSLLDSGVPVIDVRVANEYAEAHIRGAKSIPYKEKSEKATNFDSKLDTFDLTKLPGDKNAPLVFYCNGPECWKSYKSAVVTLKAGHKKVFWFRGGFPEWKSKGLPVD